MTRGQLVTMVGRKTGLTIDAGHEERDLLETWANEGVIDVLLRTHGYVEWGTMALTAGQSKYRVDDLMLAVISGRVTSSSGEYTYKIVSMDDILERSAPAANDTVRQLAFDGNFLYVYPAAATGTTLEFLFVPRPTPMTLDAHDPSNVTYGGLRTEFHRAIQYYMLWQATEYDQNSSAQNVEYYQKQYLRELMDVRKNKRHIGGRRLSPARVGYPGARVGVRNDVYPR